MFLPEKIKHYFEKNGMYLKLRYSRLVYAFWLLLRADVRKEIASKEKVYRSILPKDCKLIFDIGANEGMMTSLFSKYSRLVIAVEPSQRNVSILSARFHGHKNVMIIPKALSNVTGYQHWYEDTNDYAMGTMSRKWNDSKRNKTTAARIETVTLNDLLLKLGIPSYIKIDVEGYEQQVLEGLSHYVPLLSFEAILPRFFEETIFCIKRLLTINPSCTFNYCIDDTLVYNDYQTADVILKDIQNIQQTIDIFCKG